MTMDESTDLSLNVFYDTLGSYLNYYLVPVAKYSFYASSISLENVENILKLHEQCKTRLNTNGNDWKEPLEDVLNELDMVYIQPLQIEERSVIKGESFCTYLDLKSYQYELDNDKIIVPLPKLEPEDNNGYLSNIWLPLRHKKIYDLKSTSSAYIMVKFYETLSRCYRYEQISQESYNRNFKGWLLENVNIHLSDDVFYPGFGGVLEILEALRRPARKKTKHEHYLWQADSGDNEEQIRDKKSYYSDSTSKSKEFLDILKKSKHHQGNTIHWPNDNYSNDHDEYYQDYTEQDNKEILNRNYATSKSNKNKAKNNYKKYVKNEVPEGLGGNSTNLQKMNLSDVSRENDKFYSIKVVTPLHVIIVIIPIIALILVLVICCLKLRKKKNKQVRMRDYEVGKRKNNKNDEEETELLIKPLSKSVIHGNNNKSAHRDKNNHKKQNNSTAGSTASSSTSSLMCPISPRCFGIKRSGPAIIETTSIDSSEADDIDLNINGQTKTVKINEKSSKAKPGNSKGNEGGGPKGKLRIPKDISKSNVYL